MGKTIAIIALLVLFLCVHGVVRANVDPVIDSVTPNTGSVGGGVEVVIAGSGFRFDNGVPHVYFGGVAATGVNPIWTGYQTIGAFRCVVAPGTEGVVNVQVINPDGGSHTLSDGFTYLATPTIHSISPDSGAVAGGNRVTVNGQGFAPSGQTTLEFGGPRQQT